MSIKKEKNGTYTLFYSKTDVMTQQTSRTKKRGFATIKEAKEYERSLSRESSEVTFYSLFEECYKNKDIELATFKDNSKLFNKYLSGLKNIRYEELTKPYLLQLRTTIANYDLAPKTKNKILGLIKITCSYANTIYDLPNNSKVLKNFKIERKENIIWTPEQFRKFEAALVGNYDSYIPFFHTLFWTGMRKGEARALLVSDLDIENKSLTICKSMRRYKASLKAPKTSSSKRTIKIDNDTLRVLTPLKSHEKWLFGDYKPLNLTMIDKVFDYGTKMADLPQIRVHDLRHSHATFLICNGANIVAVSKRLGHSSINMTLSTYTHLIKDSEDKLIDLINKM